MLRLNVEPSITYFMWVSRQFQTKLDLDLGKCQWVSFFMCIYFIVRFLQHTIAVLKDI